MKKILSLILALLMIVSCASFIFAEETADLVTATASAAETDSKYYDAVQFLVDYNIMHGKGDGVLGVYDDIKRYEMALFIGRICTGWVEDDQWEDGTENNSQFTDLEGTAAENYYGAISYVAQAGIIEGVGDNKFAPEAGIKYEEALTMAVRALGYKGLAYPWGYIEKAVELGLTDGITGIAYTEALKREVVAQIIYNALFAAGADGETLAKKNFNLDLNYEIVMITEADEGHYYAYNNDSEEGYVGFQIVGADGILCDQIYYTTAESFGLTGEHDDEIALGTVYKAVFNKNTEYGLGQILSAESLEMDPILNEGANSKEAGKYPIQAFLGDVTLVRAFAKNEYNKDEDQFILVVDDFASRITIGDLVAIDWYSGDILMKDDKGVYQVAWYYNALLDTYFRYKKSVKDNGDITVAGIEFMTPATAADIYGNIGAYRTYRQDECYITVTKSDDDEVKAMLNATAYAQLRVFDFNEDGTADYGMLDNYRFGKITNKAYGLDITKLVIGDTLEQIKGYFPDKPEVWYIKYNKNVVYDYCCFNIVDLSDIPNGGIATGMLPYKNTTTCLDDVHKGYIFLQNGGASDEGDRLDLPLLADAVWYPEGFGPEYDENGEVVESFVIWGTNPSTHEVKIVKTIGEYEEGSDTYVATGILRGYNMTKKTVTIGDETFSTSYDELAGSAFTSQYYVDGIWYLGSKYFNDLYNQFVTYVVVDGYVVYMEACGAESARFFVVDSFAGISSDGYIVVNAYDTNDGKRCRVRIDSCNGWKFGDYFYYEGNYRNYISLFGEGTVLQILSYDEDDDAYGVKTIDLSKVDPNNTLGNKQWCNLNGSNRETNGHKDLTELNFVWFEAKYMFAKAGIRVTYYMGKQRLEPAKWSDLPVSGAGSNVGDGSTNGHTKNMTANDKYIFVFAPGEVAGSPVRVYEGEVKNNDWFIKGWRLCGTENNVYLFVNVLASNINGFDINKSAMTHGLVMIPDYEGGDAGIWQTDLEGYDLQVSGWQIQWGNADDLYTNANNHPWGYVTNANYDAAAGGDWYLLGNSEYEVVVLDLRTLSTITVKASDRNMKANYIYETINGEVVGEPHDANELYDLLINSYGHKDIDLDNDLVELFTTNFSTSGKQGKKAGKAENDNNGGDYIYGEFTVVAINQWLTSKWLGTAYADYGTYTIYREAKYAAVVAIHEDSHDGHVVLTVLGGQTNSGKQYAITCNGSYGDYHVLDYNGPHPVNEGNAGWPGIARMISGKNENCDVANVTIINMDNVKKAKNLNPWGTGLAAVTYMFYAGNGGVTVNHTYDKAN